MEKREIKFRLWDDKNKKWLLGYDMPNLGGFAMFGEVMLAGEYSGAIKRVEDWEHLKLMQWTGYTDINNIDVYEGDILRPINEQFGHGVVRFHQAAFWIHEFDKMYKEEVRTEMYHWVGNRIALEIIGNIYQNPELLAQ